MSKNLNEIEFTIFDTETTGLSPEAGDRIIEIAAIKFRGDQRIATLQSLVNPQRDISEAAFQVNKITQEMLKEAPTADKIIPKFLDFIKGSCLCSYNAPFDMEFISKELELIGQGILESVEIVDILKMARRLLPGLERHALWFVADKFGIKRKQEHRAFADVELTLDVFYRLKEMLKAKGIDDFINFRSLFSVNRRLLDNINNQKISQIQQAIDLGVKLRIKYISSSNAKVSEREVLPKEIKQERNNSYLVGFCSLRNEERTFRTDGILQLEII
ncbi:MAG: WYL domain-containing protein [Candidatus Omnitrophica bacterium]|nr:WYL domain-containing protein [Candidatus Omnitrophota bacterium]